MNELNEVATINEMLRTRKDKMLITDCLAISEILKHLSSLSAENKALKAALEKLISAANGAMKTDANWWEDLQAAIDEGSELFEGK